MASSSPSSRPEELVRQRLIRYMQEQCGFPKNLMAVEKSLNEMPHLQNAPSSKERRIDLICFARDIHPRHSLYPLVLAECKADALTTKAVQQAFGYNAQIGAPFVLLASSKELRLYTGDPLQFIPHLPPYGELIAQAKLMYGT